jgi:hypothetical protein
MARVDTLYNARFSVDGAAWWDKTTDAAAWASVAAMSGAAPVIDDPANLVSPYQNLVATAKNVLYWVGLVAGVPTLFSFDGTTQTALTTFPDQGGQPVLACNAICEFDNNIYLLLEAAGAGTTILYRWNPDTLGLTGIQGSVTDAGARGMLCSALGLLWMIESPHDSGKLYRIDPRTTGGWTVDTTAPAGIQYTSCIGYQGSLFVASRSASTIDVWSKNSVAGALGPRYAWVLRGGTDGIWRFVADEINSVILAYRSDLATTGVVLKSVTGLSGWAQEVDLVASLSLDPTALVGQGGVFNDQQYFAAVGASGFLIQRNAGVYTAVHAGPIGLGLGLIAAPAPPSAGRGFSLIQAGDKLYALTLSGDFSKEIVLPAGITIDGTARIRYAILARKIVVGGTPGISAPIFIDPKTLIAYPLRMAGPGASAPVLTGGAVNGLAIGWVTFIQKIDNIVVNESPLSDPSAASTSRIFTSIAVPPVGSAATGRRLYRSVVNGTVPFQAVDIDDITTTTFDTNGISDAELQLTPADEDLGEAPSDLDLLVAWRDRIWARSATDGQQDNGYFTAVGEYWAWNPTNYLRAQPVGEDVFGITGWLPRRDELGMLKRARVLKIVGTGVDADFDVIVVADGIGCVSPDSCVVIRDIGYFMGQDGPYRWGPEGVQPIFDDKVTPWFQTDVYFNRSMFRQAVGGYNAINDTYDLHLASAGSTVLDRWVSFDLGRREWLGPSLTNRFTTYGRGLLRDEDAQYQPSMGGNDGFIYKMNRPGASDEGVAIAIDWILGWLSGGAPDIEHRWLQATVFVRIEPGATGKLLLTARVGGLDAPDTAALEVDLTTDRTRLPRFGTGRLLRLQFTHATNGEDVLVEALEIPFNEIGRR